MRMRRSTAQMGVYPIESGRSYLRRSTNAKMYVDSSGPMKLDTWFDTDGREEPLGIALLWFFL
jgi:hypothetical protein